jgi:hypothetical protein
LNKRSQGFVLVVQTRANGVILASESYRGIPEPFRCEVLNPLDFVVKRRALGIVSAFLRLLGCAYTGNESQGHDTAFAVGVAASRLLKSYPFKFNTVKPSMVAPDCAITVNQALAGPFP